MAKDIYIGKEEKKKETVYQLKALVRDVILVSNSRDTLWDLREQLVETALPRQQKAECPSVSIQLGLLIPFFFILNLTLRIEQFSTRERIASQSLIHEESNSFTSTFNQSALSIRLSLGQGKRKEGVGQVAERASEVAPSIYAQRW